MKLIWNKNLNWFIIFLFLFFISEALYKYFIDLGLKEYRIAGVVKFLAQLVMLFVILKNYKSNRVNIILIGLISLGYIIGQLTLSNSDSIIGNLEYLNNALFIIIMLLFFNTLKFDDQQKTIALKYFEIVIIINSIAVLLGVLFSIDYFQTYQGNASRFGYNGFLMKPSYGSYFYLISSFYFCHKYLVLKNQKISVLLLVLIAAALTGTKAALLSVVLCLIYILIKTKLYRNKIFIGAIGMCITAVLLFKERIYEFFLAHSPIYSKLIDEHGISTALFSSRNLILQEQLIPYISSEWGFINYLFGGMGIILYKCGFDILDLIYFFGFIGAALYIYLFSKVFLTTKLNFDIIYFVFIIFVVSSLGGNLFYNSSLAIFFSAIKFYFELVYEPKN